MVTGHTSCTPARPHMTDGGATLRRRDKAARRIIAPGAFVHRAPRAVVLTGLGAGTPVRPQCNPCLPARQCRVHAGHARTAEALIP